MEELKEKILKEGVAIGTEVVKVDNFLNHMLDVEFLDRISVCCLCKKSRTEHDDRRRL